MGLFDDDDLELDDLLESVKKYPSCVVDLNEGEVQAIFNRCLATSTSVEKTSSILFYREFGYEKDDIGIVFDRIGSLSLYLIKLLFLLLAPEFHES